MTRTKRKIIKFSNYSFCVTLPKKAVDALGWKKGQAVSVNFDEKSKRIHIFRARANGDMKKLIVQSKQKTKKTAKSTPRLRW
ncbi:MAG: hypothetical protein CEN89_579 [Candidatus Berkelbacteria bacterium Licking1014_7]|uniref:SpoVT-AbrB domain-containing protein n=1 Tax=Candidatus Berkelbacteria bacterium Licking1014_7 TaxID=2017147 RepID=A0A554LJ31_9BACT|nr:MAG: hypothetical protein CEN89_579 [Candidatus Berkelbacteria bacterium Licking1014_7]